MSFHWRIWWSFNSLFPLSIITDVDAERLLTVKTLIEYVEGKLDGMSDLFQDMIPVDYKDPNPDGPQ